MSFALAGAPLPVFLKWSVDGICQSILAPTSDTYCICKPTDLHVRDHMYRRAAWVGALGRG
jgi:hypothetical protein